MTISGLMQYVLMRISGNPPFFPLYEMIILANGLSSA